MKTILVLLLTTSVALSQDYTISSGYHLFSSGTALGIAGSANITTWNNRKVIFRLSGAYYSGSTHSYNAALGTRERFELSLESKNTMVTGLPYFNIIQIGYHQTYSRTQVASAIERDRNTGAFFSFGFGTRISSPVSVMVRYVTGFDNGFRFTLDYDL